MTAQTGRSRPYTGAESLESLRDGREIWLYERNHFGNHESIRFETLLVADVTGATNATRASVTTNLSGGWLRRNGVPYSENAIVTEYFDRLPVPNGGESLVVTTEVDDPMYLRRSFVTSRHSRREPDDSEWSPRPCRA